MTLQYLNEYLNSNSLSLLNSLQLRRNVTVETGAEVYVVPLGALLHKLMHTCAAGFTDNLVIKTCTSFLVAEDA